MNKTLVKIRVLCDVQGDYYYDYIRYDDKVPDVTHAWKGTRKHNNQSVVALGEPWSNPVAFNDGATYWNAYAILDAGSTDDEKAAKEEELFGIVRQAVLEHAKALLEKAGQSTFDRGTFLDKVKRYDGR